MSLSRFPQVLLATGKAGCAAQCVKGPVLPSSLHLVQAAPPADPTLAAPALPAVGTGLPRLRSRRTSVNASRVPGSPSSPCPGHVFSESVSLGFSPTPPGWRKRAGRGEGQEGQEGGGVSRQEGPADPTVSHRPSWDPGWGAEAGLLGCFDPSSKASPGALRAPRGRKAGLAEGAPCREEEKGKELWGLSRASCCPSHTSPQGAGKGEAPGGAGLPPGLPHLPLEGELRPRSRCPWRKWVLA